MEGPNRTFKVRFGSKLQAIKLSFFRDLIYVSPDASLYEAVSLLIENKIHRWVGKRTCQD